MAGRCAHHHAVSLKLSDGALVMFCQACPAEYGVNPAADPRMLAWARHNTTLLGDRPGAQEVLDAFAAWSASPRGRWFTEAEAAHATA